MRRALLVAVLLAGASMAGCLQGNPMHDNDRPRHVSLKQVHDEREGVATFELQSRAPDMTLDVLLVAVNGTLLERAPACPPPPGAWAWCGDPAFRVGGLLQARAEPGDLLRVGEEPDRNVLMTVGVR